jgi:hypothetical protein
MSRKHNCEYPIGSISSGTMLTEDLLPNFLWELKNQANKIGVSRKLRAASLKLYREISKRVDNYHSGDDTTYFESEESDFDLDALCNALDRFSGPYFYFGAHPGDGADYGYWLSEGFEDEFDGLKVSDLSEVPAKYRGEVLVINDHGNMSLYVKTSRALREVWSVV